VTKPIQTINRYKADLREFTFLLFEQLGIAELLGKAPYDAWGEEEVKTSLAECYRFAREVLGPLNVVGDIQGCKLVDGRVITPDGFKDAWTKLYEAGWKSLAVPAEHGGAGAPRMLQVLVEEILSGSNAAFNMYPAWRTAPARSSSTSARRTRRSTTAGPCSPASGAAPCA